MSYPKVTVVGAGHVGATTAWLIATKRLADVVLVDVAEGLPQGKALDMMHARSVERFGPSVTGSNGYDDTAGSDVVVVTAGLPRKPGMSRDDLLAANSAIVRSVISQAVAESPDAIFLCVTNPLDVMTNLAWRASGLPAERVMGMGAVLDSARFAYFIAEATGASIEQVEALVIGMHGDAMVPLPAHSLVDGRPLTEVVPRDLVEDIVARTIDGGAEVVRLLKTGSAYYAPASSVTAMVAAILGDARVSMPSCVLLDGQYGVSGIHMSVPAVLGRCGVVVVPELELADHELEAVKASAEQISEALAALERAV